MRHALSLSAFATAILIASAILISLVGCERPEDPMLRILETTASQTRVDDLSRTMDYVFSERQFDQVEFNNNVSLGLNRWSGYSGDAFTEVAWTPDESISELAQVYENAVPAAARIEGSSFQTTDAQYLQALSWLDTIGKRVKANPYIGQYELYRLMADEYDAREDDEAFVDSIIKKLNPDLSPEDGAKLSLTVQLFDWVTRNIQLDETPDYTAEEIEELSLVEADTLPAAGLAAAGSTRSAWQLLTFARGDYVEKAKLFMMLCHQADLPAVMLATGETQTPWAVGVGVGDSLFLFDTKLGLPIPGKDNKSIATLSEVTEDPALLSRLDLSVKESIAEDTKYWVTADDLESLTGFVYWTPESVSERMAVLERSIVGDQQMSIVQRPDEIVPRLPKLDNVSYKPWDIALKTAQFRKVVGESLPKAITDDALAEKLSWYFIEEGYVMQFPIYRTARSRFLRGKFSRPPESRSRDAIESFALLMYEDETIDGLQTDRQLQQMIGIRKDGVTPAEFERDIASRQAQMRLVRRDAGYFMCQSHFDNGSISTTANWVPKLLDEQDVERWESGLKYLYARSLEARHQYDEAIEILKVEGPQQHGNLIRARLLKEQIETHFASKQNVAAESAAETADEEPAESDDPVKADADDKDADDN